MLPSPASLATHAERLRRHYDAVFNTYDHLSLLDLSHALRMWADLKASIGKKAPTALSTLKFRSATPQRQMLTGLRDIPYVVAYLPGEGVFTRANRGEGPAECAEEVRL